MRSHTASYKSSLLWDSVLSSAPLCVHSSFNTPRHPTHIRYLSQNVSFTSFSVMHWQRTLLEIPK